MADNRRERKPVAAWALLLALLPAAADAEPLVSPRALPHDASTLISVNLTHLEASHGAVGVASTAVGVRCVFSSGGWRACARESDGLSHCVCEAPASPHAVGDAILSLILDGSDTL